MSKGSTSSDAPFGTLLGYAPGGVAIYSSNYSSLNPQDYPDDATFRSYIGNEYMGHKWQCVEFARRFLFLTYGLSLPMSAWPMKSSPAFSARSGQ
jgi:glutathionylspermidine amidase/synthetase